MYARFWCRLHTIDDTAGKHATLVSLCVLFLHLLEVCCIPLKHLPHKCLVYELRMCSLLSAVVVCYFQVNEFWHACTCR